MSKSYLGIDVNKKRCIYTEIDFTGKVTSQGWFAVVMVAAMGARDGIKIATREHRYQ